jgi:hypothetical protein
MWDKICNCGKGWQSRVEPLFLRIFACSCGIIVSHVLLIFGEHTVAERHIAKNIYLEHAVMVNPGAFQGARKDFLLSQKAEYKAGVLRGYAGDPLAQIQ